MKKVAILLVFIFATASLTSCKSTKNGCGLTGDATSPSSNPIENISSVESEIV
jgi:uncharacterized lipoprotein YajG